MAIKLQGEITRREMTVWERLRSPLSAVKNVGLFLFSSEARSNVYHVFDNRWTKKTANTEFALDEAGRLAKRVEKESAMFRPLSEEANRTFHRTIADKGAEKGYFGASVKRLWHRTQEALGRDVSDIGSKTLPKNAFDLERNIAEARRANIFERFLTKPIRVAANHPRVALLVASAAALWGGSNWLSNRDAGRTKIETLNAMAASQAPMGSPVMNNPYMNSVNPMESALLEARMRGGEGVRNGFSDKIMADRAAAAALANPAQQNS